MNLKNNYLIVFILLLNFNSAVSQLKETTYEVRENIAYRDQSADEYAKSRCVLDLYFPKNKEGFVTIVWFHGGGLVGGEKYIPDGLKKQGVAVVAINYRLSPKAQHPAYIEDAAASVAWAFDHIKAYGGDPSKIYVAGHSAGGYLALMVALDAHYLKDNGADVDQVKGFFPISGQTITHNAIRKELDRPENVPYADEFAPLNHVTADGPPMVLITGDRDLDIPARYAENAYLYEALRNVGNDHTILYEVNGFDHNAVVAPACNIIIRAIREKEK